MMVSSIYGGLFGIIILCIEVLWKYSLLSCCCCITNKIRGNQDKLPFGFKVYAVATWMVFSHERFVNWPYFMRILDIFIWTIICVTISIVGVFFHYEFPQSFNKYFIGRVLYKVKVDGICNEFGMFRQDCYPMEILIIIGFLLILLGIIYKLSPSIFTLLQKTKEQRQKEHLEQQQRNHELEQPKNHNFIEMQRAVIVTMNEEKNSRPSIQQLPHRDYLQTNAVIIDRMNESQSPSSPSFPQRSQYIQQQHAMIDTMNAQDTPPSIPPQTPPKDYLVTNAVIIDRMNEPQIQKPPQSEPNYLNQQRQMIQSMNAPQSFPQMPQQNYLNTNAVIIDRMNEPNYLNQQQQMIQSMNSSSMPMPPPPSNYITSQQAMIGAMNGNYIQQQGAMIQAMNQQYNQQPPPNYESTITPNYVNQQRVIIQQMNDTSRSHANIKPNYIQSQMRMINRMND